MGKGKKITAGYRYFMTVHFGLCHGPVDALLEVRAGDLRAWQGNASGGTVSIAAPNLFGGEKKEGGLQGPLYLLMGEADQPPLGALAAIEPGPRPAYRGLFTAVFSGLVGAMNPYLKAWGFRVARYLKGWSTPVWESTLCKVDRGMNPAHIIYQCLTDTAWGLGLPPSIIDAVAFRQAAVTLQAEGLGLCLKWVSTDSVARFITTVCSHIGAVMSEDPTTGLQQLILYRDDYDLTELTHLDESAILELTRFQQTGLDATVNQVTVKYRDVTTNRDAAVTVQNLANVQAQGRVIAQNAEYPGLWNAQQAARVAERDCRSASALLASVEMTVKSTHWRIRKGDVILWSWKRRGIARMPLRVLEIDQGDTPRAPIKLSCAQDVFGLADTSYIRPVVGGWQEPDATPQPIPNQRLVEVTYRDLAQQLDTANLQALTVDAGFIAALGARPSALALDYALTVQAANGLATEVARGDFCPSGVLAAAIGPLDTAVVLQSTQDLEEVEIGSSALIEEERVRVDALDPATGKVTFGRGCIDTVPASHVAGARVWFLEDYAAVDATEFSPGERVTAKLLTITGRGTLDPSRATALSIVVNERQGRPYPPGNLFIQNQRYPPTVEGALTLRWAHRDRCLQADKLIDTLQTNIGPEPGTTYTVRVIIDGTLDSSTAAVATTELTPAVTRDGKLRVEVLAARDSLTSWQALTAEADYLRGSALLTEDGDGLVTEDGLILITES